MAAKKATKKGSVRRTAATKESAKGKRYSDAKRRQVVDFVNQVNAEKGRGGVSAATRKFGITTMTISKWVKSGPGLAPTRATRGRKAASGELLEQLVALDTEIRELEARLSEKRAQFDKLKRQL